MLTTRAPRRQNSARGPPCYRGKRRAETRNEKWVNAALCKKQKKTVLLKRI
jgi:hypothetical protein